VLLIAQALHQPTLAAASQPASWRTTYGIIDRPEGTAAAYLHAFIWKNVSAVTILKSKSKIAIFLSKSTKIEIVIFAKLLLRFFCSN